MKRREFITLLGGAAAWPLAARAQQSDRMRRIGVLMNRAPDSPEGQARFAAFQQALQQLGWSDGRNVRIDTRWGEDIAERERRAAAELDALAPDVILASGTLSVLALQQLNRTTPIVFVAVTDPVGAALVDTLARPGGNATGFMIYEYSFGGKRLDLLKQIAPSVTRVAVLKDPRMEVSPLDSRRDADEIERAVAAFARSPNGALILVPNASISVRSDLIITIAARHKLPVIYPFRYMVTSGGLMSYGPDVVDQCRQAAGYVDRILKGEKPADLPVQNPTKYELVINLKTAKALGIEVPDKLLVAADEVIE
jgi:putative tryptophan/tyrosine transport system substrate-binding protein